MKVNMKLPKTLGMLLLGIWLIVTGLLQVVNIHIPAIGTYSGSARYRCWCFDPAWSVSGSVSASAVLMSEWNPEGSQAAYHPLRRPGVPRRLHHLGLLCPGRETAKERLL